MSKTMPNIIMEPMKPMRAYNTDTRSRIRGSEGPGIALNALIIDKNADHTSLTT